MKSFSIIFTGGFAVASDYDQLAYIVNQVSGVDIKEASSPLDAYKMCCTTYTKGKTPMTFNLTNKLPDFDKICTTVFTDNGFIPNNCCQRYFACISFSNFEIATSINEVINFLYSFNRSMVKEFPNYEGANFWINSVYWEPILPLGAYLQKDLPFIEIPLNKTLEVNYYEWLKTNCSFPPEEWFSLPETPSVNPIPNPVVDESRMISLPVDKLVDFSNNNS